MAKRTKDSSEIPTTAAAPKRRKAVGARATRKVRPEAPKPVAEAAEIPEPEQTAADIELGPASEEIAKRAYEIYLRRGSRNGYDFDDWLEAERELRGRGKR
jgi:hypothetical protein